MQTLVVKYGRRRGDINLEMEMKGRSHATDHAPSCVVWLSDGGWQQIPET